MICRPLLLAYLILVGTTLLLLAVAGSIRPQAAAAHSAYNENQSTVHAPLYTASSVWTNVPVTNSGLDGTILKAVTVDSAGTVWAVGYSGPTMVIISSTNQGSSWAVYTQTLGTSSQLYGVAAVAPNDVFAVGYYSPPGTGETQTLVMHYNGSNWSRVSSISFSNYDSRLLAVAATTGGDVWAVGHKQDRLNPGGIYTLAERWDSTSGTFVLPPTSPPSPYSADLLYGVALSGANNVWVVGEASTRGLIEYWNGTNWIYTTYRPDSTAQDAFHAVALDPNGNARVGGWHQMSTVYPLFTRWTLNSNGTAIVAASNPFTDTRLSGSNYLYGIAVTTTNDAWVAGTFTLTEHYDGLSWEVIPAEQVGSIQQALYGVAVDPVHDGAWAVGYYTNGGNFRPLVERYTRPVTPQPPSPTTSYYITDLSLLSGEGCSAAQAITQSFTEGIIVLDFGVPAISYTLQSTISGTNLLDDASTFVPIDKILSGVESFASGFHQCLIPNLGGSPHMTIAIGTNNFTSTVTLDPNQAEKHGKVWAQMVNDVYNYLKTNKYLDYLSVAAGIDIELLWRSPQATTSWTNGYNSTGNWPYYNYGACEGCPSIPNIRTTWTITDVYNVSWGGLWSLPLPEIYAESGVNADQWRQIAVRTLSYNHGRMIISGAFTQHAACHSNLQRLLYCQQNHIDNPPGTGWIQLWQALNYDPTQRTSQDLNWSTDINWDR